MGIGISAAYINHESDPTEEAIIYFRAFVGRDYDKMYDCLDIDHDYYLDKKVYTEYIDNLRDDDEIGSYEISDIRDDGGKTFVTITYEQADTTDELVITFSKNRRGLQIIPNYKVSIEDIIAEDFSVKVNSGDILELNGCKPDKVSEEKNKDEKDIVIYRVRGLVKGKYKISAVNEFGAIDVTCDIESDNETIDLTGKEYTANKKYKELITDKGKKSLEYFYKSVRARKVDEKKIAKYFGSDKKLVEKVKAYLNSSMDVVYWPEVKKIEQYTVKEMDIGQLNPDIIYNNKDKTYTVIYEYTYKYQSATSTELYNSFVYNISGKCDTKVTLEYVIDNDELQLKNFKMKNTNHKNIEE